MLLSIRYTLGILLSMILSAPVMAEVLPDNSQDMIITGSLGKTGALESLRSTDPDLDGQALEFSYNPKDYEGNFDTTGNKEQLLESLRAEMKLEQDSSVVKIPVAPSTNEQMQKIETMSEAELQMFLGKKTKFLERMSKVLSFFHLKAKMINKVLNEVNNKFYNSARLIANSNAVGATVMISVSGGIALPRKIVERLEGRSVGKYIPKSGGFAYLLGFGAGFGRHIQPSGRSHWVFDVFVDVERLKKTITGIVEVSTAGTYGVVYELREGSFKSQKTDTTYGGVAGVFRQGEAQFGWAASTGLSFPPGIGAILVFDNETTRHYLLRLDFTKIKKDLTEATQAIVLSWQNAMGLRKGKTSLCLGVFL